jgi:hypothetical protein
LEVVQILAVRPSMADALLLQLLFQQLDPQLCPMQLAFQICDTELGIESIHARKLHLSEKTSKSEYVSAPYTSFCNARDRS